MQRKELGVNLPSLEIPGVDKLLKNSQENW